MLHIVTASLKLSHGSQNSRCAHRTICNNNNNSSSSKQSGKSPTHAVQFISEIRSGKAKLAWSTNTCRELACMKLFRDECVGGKSQLSLSMAVGCAQVTNFHGISIVHYKRKASEWSLNNDNIQFHSKRRFHGNTRYNQLLRKALTFCCSWLLVCGWPYTPNTHTPLLLVN